MSGFSDGTILFYSGIIGMIVAAIGAVISIVIFSVSGNRLKRKLDEEYGKKKR